MFDALGKPWPKHSCWIEHRKQAAMEAGVREELEAMQFNGIFALPDGRQVSRPDNDDFSIVVTGYVAENDWTYQEPPVLKLRAHLRASTIELYRVRVWSAGYLYPFLLPSGAASLVPDYAPVRARGKWYRNGIRWYLICDSMKQLDSANPSSQTRLRKHEGTCFACGRNVAQRWGFDEDGRMECETCGEMRGHMNRREFKRQVARINSAR